MAADAANTQKKDAAEAPKAETQKVHVLNAAENKKRSQRAQARRRRMTYLSFLALVIVPIALAATYFFGYASDRYYVETKFAVRSPSSALPSGDLLTMFTGVSSSGSTTSDSYMIVDFVESRGLVTALEERLDLRAIYDTDQADFLTRLPADSTTEDLADYMQRMVKIHLDTTSQILTLETQAFTPEDTQFVSQSILDVLTQLVNEVSEQARFDSMASAERELARIEAELDAHRAAMAQFRAERQDVDPEASAGAQILLLSQLEGELAAARTRLNSLLDQLNEDAPTVRVMKSEIQSLEEQIAAQREKLGAGQDGTVVTNDAGRTMSEQLSIYESLAVDQQFLQQAYISALAAREAARLEADRQQRYIASFVQPALPEASLFPKRGRNTAVFAGFALMFWGIFLMVVYVIREHAT